MESHYDCDPWPLPAPLCQEWVPIELTAMAKVAVNKMKFNRKKEESERFRCVYDAVEKSKSDISSVRPPCELFRLYFTTAMYI